MQQYCNLLRKSTWISLLCHFIFWICYLAFFVVMFTYYTILVVHSKDAFVFMLSMTGFICVMLLVLSFYMMFIYELAEKKCGIVNDDNVDNIV